MSGSHGLISQNQSGPLPFALVHAAAVVPLVVVVLSPVLAAVLALAAVPSPFPSLFPVHQSGVASLQGAGMGRHWLERVCGQSRDGPRQQAGDDDTWLSAY